MSFFTDDDRKMRAEREAERKTDCTEDAEKAGPIALELLEDLTDTVRSLYREGYEISDIHIRDKTSDNEHGPWASEELVRDILRKEISKIFSIPLSSFKVTIHRSSGNYISGSYDEYYKHTSARVIFNPHLQ